MKISNEALELMVARECPSTPLGNNTAQDMARELLDARKVVDVARNAFLVTLSDQRNMDTAIDAYDEVTK